jgi:hypothetical protein
LIDDPHEIASIGKLHDDAQIAGYVVIESFLELDDILIIKRGEDSDLIQSVFFLLFLHARHSDLLQCVDLVVYATTHLIHLPECTFTNFLQHFELF